MAFVQTKARSSDLDTVLNKSYVVLSFAIRKVCIQHSGNARPPQMKEYKISVIDPAILVALKLLEFDALRAISATEHATARQMYVHNETRKP